MPRTPYRYLLPALLALSAAGCYTYRPVTTAPTPGQRVRVALTAEGTTELARYLGPRVDEAEGSLISVAADTIVVAVDFVRMVDGTRQPWSGEGIVSFPAAYVAQLRERTFLRRQSIVAGTSIAGGLVVIAVTALRMGGAGGSGGPGPPPPPP